MINRRIHFCGSKYRLPLLPLQSYLGLAPPPPTHPLARLIMLLVAVVLFASHCSSVRLSLLLGLGVPALIARALCRPDLALLIRCRRPSALSPLRGRAGVRKLAPLRLFRATAGGRASRRSAVLGRSDKRTIHPRPPYFIGSVYLQV